MQGFPAILSALLFTAVFKPGMVVSMVAIGIAFVPAFARLTRGAVLELREREFVVAARALGGGDTRLVARHILPNAVSPLVVQFTLSISNIVLLESTLSFLGMGVQPPTATLGSMVGIGRDYMPTAPWIVIAPAVMILLVTFAVQILGDWLRDRADVRLRGR